MPEAVESIQTRQRAELLFHTDETLGAGGSFAPMDTRLVAGYNAVAFFAVSDQPFEIRVLEGCSKAGRFVVTETLASVAAGANQVVCERVLPCGPLMRVALANLGAPQQSLSFCALGIPEP